jgi:hypothetical protein
MARKMAARPSNFTEPVIEPAVAVSTTAVGAGISGDPSGSFFLQPMIPKRRANNKATTTGRILNGKHSFPAPLEILASSKDSESGFSALELAPGVRQNIGSIKTRHR